MFILAQIFGSVDLVGSEIFGMTIEGKSVNNKRGLETFVFMAGQRDLTAYVYSVPQ